MNRKYKIISSDYNKETGVSTVTIQTPKGLFTGHSYLQECDRKIESEFAGCRYAEIKAFIKYIESDLRELKSQSKTYKEFYINLTQSKHFKENSYEAKRFRKFINDIDKKIAELKCFRDYHYQCIMNLAADRERTIAQLNLHVKSD